jgi:hypothetical protein
MVNSNESLDCFFALRFGGLDQCRFTRSSHSVAFSARVVPKEFFHAPKSQSDSEARNGANPVFGNSKQQYKGSVSGSCAEECAVFKGLQGTLVLKSLDDPPVRA